MRIGIRPKQNCSLLNLPKLDFGNIKLYTPDKFYSSSWATQILPNLYLGSFDDAINVSALKNNNIKFVLNISNDCETPKKEYETLNISYLQISLRDHSDENIKQYFYETSKIIFEQLQSGYSVLVHCKMGVSRSATIVIAYLMTFGFNYKCPEKKPYKECFSLVKQKRNIVCPNLGFCLALVEFNQEIGFEQQDFFSSENED